MTLTKRTMYFKKTSWLFWNTFLFVASPPPTVVFVAPHHMSSLHAPCLLAVGM